MVWSTRWDHILTNQNTSIHWLSLLSSIVFAIIFACLVFSILCKSVKSDIEIINNAAFAENSIDETKWKQVSNEVFRKPQKPMIFSAFIGSGLQVLDKK